MGTGPNVLALIAGASPWVLARGYWPVGTSPIFRREVSIWYITHFLKILNLVGT